MKDILSLRAPKTLPSIVPVMDFNEKLLPMALREYVFDIADRQQCAPDFVAVSAMCALSSLIGKKIIVKPKMNDDWLISVNLWGCLIGGPSSMKTPSMSAALAPLKTIEKQIMSNYEKATKAYSIIKKGIDIKNKNAQAEALKILKAEGDEAMKIYLEQNTFDYPPLRRERISVNDSTVEKLGELLRENENGLLLVRDELSAWLVKLYKEEYHSDRAFYLECYNGNNSYICDRIERGTIHIKNAMMSVVGGLQPSVISPLIESAKSGSIDDGLLQRLQLSVWPDENRKWEWRDKKPNSEAKRTYENIFEKFYSFSPESQLVFGLDDGAYILFKKFMDKIHLLIEGDINPAFKSYILKLPKTIISLALIIQLADNFDDSKYRINSDSFFQASLWVDYLISHARKIYSSEDQVLIVAHSLVERFEKLPEEFTASYLKKKEWKGLNDKEFINKVLDVLVEYDYLIPRSQQSTSKGGFPTIYYRKNFIGSPQTTP